MRRSAGHDTFGNWGIPWLLWDAITIGSSRGLAMPHKGERQLLMTMAFSLSNEILTFLRASPGTRYRCIFSLPHPDHLPPATMTGVASSGRQLQYFCKRRVMPIREQPIRSV